MASATLEERISAVETELAQLKRRLPSDKSESEISWWEQRFGAFTGSEEYEAAAQAGADYRASLRDVPEESA